MLACAPDSPRKSSFVGDSKKNVLYIPRQALFMKDGKRIVYVKSRQRISSSAR